MLEKAIIKRIDMKIWEATKTIEEREQEKLERLASKMKRVV